MFDFFKKKEKEVKPVFDSLKYKIAYDYGYYHIKVKSENTNWIHITYYLRDVLKIKEELYDINSNNVICGCSKNIKEAEKYLDRFCQLVVKYDRNEITSEEKLEYVDEGSLKEFYVVNNV